MRFTLDIDLGSDAMQTPGDVARTLSGLADKLGHSGTWARLGGGVVVDDNGNTVGFWELANEEES